MYLENWDDGYHANLNEMEDKKVGSKSLWTKQLKSRSTNGHNYGQWIMKND
jgi:hypothetical protein